MQDKHPYRLVILNGCNTYGPQWCWAFGIKDYAANGSTKTVADLFFAGKRVQAFVGWEKELVVPTAGTSSGNQTYSMALGLLFGAWMDGLSLEEGLRRYAQYQIVSGDLFSNMTSHESWKITGATDLSRNSPGP